uniref:Ubiquitin-like protease family profile domain-containing protein n=1 Tax=Chenopodium quinoa TaxID=63459 RepID=A0A803MZM7_CHEQI
MNNLCKSVGSFKNNKNKESRSGFSGCVLILQLVYFHNLAFRGNPELTILPLIQDWSDEKVKERIAKEAKRPLELSLKSKDASQPTDKKTEVKSPSVHSQELNQAWYDWMCLCDAKEKIMTAQLGEEMSNFLKRINHEKTDEIIEYEFDEVNFKWKTPRYTLDCGVFAIIHMLCFSGETFDSDLHLANRRKVYRAEICATLALTDINTKRKQLERKISRFRVVRKLEKEKWVEDMICVSDFLKKHKEVMDNMSLQCYQVIDYLAINDGENFPNKSEVVGWFIDSIEIVNQDSSSSATSSSATVVSSSAVAASNSAANATVANAMSL